VQGTILYHQHLWFEQQHCQDPFCTLGPLVCLHLRLWGVLYSAVCRDKAVDGHSLSLGQQQLCVEGAVQGAGSWQGLRLACVQAGSQAGLALHM
jgi:hypothetical protein